jgi:hypothetical protein
VKSIPLTRGKETVVDDEDYEALRRYKWYATTNGYAGRDFGRRGSHETVFIHQQIMGGSDVDHVNRNPLDNRRANLRYATRSQQMMNRNKQAMPATSAYKGVSWDATRNKWRATVQIYGKHAFIGRFDDEHQAAFAYDVAATLLFGQFAVTNSVHHGSSLNRSVIDRISRLVAGPNPTAVTTGEPSNKGGMT